MYLEGSFCDGSRDACCNVAEREVATFAPSWLSVVGLKYLVNILVLFFGLFFFDGHEEMLQVIGKMRITLAAVLAYIGAFSRLRVNRLVAPGSLLLAVGTEVPVAFREPTLEAVQAEFPTCCQFDEEVLAACFAPLIGDALADADVLA